MKRWLVRFILLGVGLAVVGFLVAASGLISIKASSGHWRITEFFLRFGMKRSVATHSLGTKVPTNLADRDLIQKGAAHYEFACRSCHGEPGAPRPRVAAHMLPVPPDLEPRVRESDAKKLFQVVKHGMKFTGMPAWPAQEREDEVWEMVAFLLKYPELDAAAYRRLAGRDTVETPDVSPIPSPPPPVVAQSCVRCHGADGLSRGNAAMPILAGQRAEYMRAALDAYATDHRKSGTMGPVAVELSAAARDELADYYARLPRPARVLDREGEIDPKAIARGEAIARNGIPAQRVPICLECHGTTGSRGKPEYPLLAGQPARYLELQLALLRENRRGGSQHAHLMQPVAARLTQDQARDVAAYFASLGSVSSPDARAKAESTKP